MPKSSNGRWQDIQWLDMTNEHFIVWMRTAAQPGFKKIWGYIRDGLEAGEHIIEIDNQYEVSTFHGQKFIIMSTMSKFGGNNRNLAISYMVTAVVCLLLSFSFCIIDKNIKKFISDEPDENNKLA